MRLRTERYQPYVVGTVGGALAAWWHMRYGVGADAIKDLLVASISICAIVVGFLATAQAIVLSLHRSRVIRQIKETMYDGTHTYYDLMLRYLMAPIWASFIAATLSCVGLFVGLPTLCGWMRLGLGVWALSMATTAALSFRAVHILQQTLRLAATDGNSAKG
jgi:hypothetical protein